MVKGCDHSYCGVHHATPRSASLLMLRIPMPLRTFQGAACHVFVSALAQLTACRRSPGVCLP